MANRQYDASGPSQCRNALAGRGEPSLSVQTALQGRYAFMEGK